MKLKSEKNSGLNGIETHDLCDAGAVLSTNQKKNTINELAHAHPLAFETASHFWKLANPQKPVTDVIWPEFCPNFGERLDNSEQTI